MQRKKLWKGVGAGTCALLLLGVSRVQSETKLRGLIAEQPHSSPPRYDPQKLAGRNRRARKLYQLWMARDTRDVAAQVVPFLQDEDADIRRSAVRVLGRLESPAGEAALTRLLQDAERGQGSGGQVPEHTLKLALGRIKSRSLKGKAKVEAVSGGLGLSFGEVGRLSQRVTGQRETKGTAGDEAVQEVVDVLYRMGKKGEDIQWFANRLSLNPAQKIKLRGAALPLEQEAKIILDYASQQAVVTSDDAQLGGRHLIGLGPVAVRMAIQRLAQMKEQREKYQSREGYVTLFRAVALASDSRALPVLKQFEQDADSYISAEAMMARKTIEQGAASPFFPPLP